MTPTVSLIPKKIILDFYTTELVSHAKPPVFQSVFHAPEKQILVPKYSEEVLYKIPAKVLYSLDYYNAILSKPEGWVS